MAGHGSGPDGVVAIATLEDDDRINICRRIGVLLRVGPDGFHTWRRGWFEGRIVRSAIHLAGGIEILLLCRGKGGTDERDLETFGENAEIWGWSARINIVWICILRPRCAGTGKVRGF